MFIAIYACSIIRSYEIGEFRRNRFFHVRMQNCELVKNCARMIQTRSQIFKAIYTSFTILSFEIGIFSRNSFLHIRIENMSSSKIVHE